ncbi:unnamed protein product [Ascophyllum nodosum]
MPGNKLALYVDRHPLASDLFELPRALAVLRLLTVFPSLRKFLETISTVPVMVVKILVLYVYVSHSFAAIGMALFADSKSDILAPRYSFSTLPEALLALFFLTVTNNWNDLLPLSPSKLGRSDLTAKDMQEKMEEEAVKIRWLKKDFTELGKTMCTV